MSIQYKPIHSNNYIPFSTFRLPLHLLSDFVESRYLEEGKERVRRLSAVRSSASAKPNFDLVFVAATYSVAGQTNAQPQ